MASQNPDAYSMVLAMIGLADLERQTIMLSKTLDADGSPTQASEIRRTYFAFLDELKSIAQQTADQAKAAIKREQIASQVRGSSGMGDSLDDYIGASSPLHSVEGSVGINDEEFLAHSPVFWWWTNEEGYSGFVEEKRRIFGFFSPSGDVPRLGGGTDTGFVPASKANGGGPGIIKNPIPARYFVRDGAQEAADDWHVAVQAARRAFMDACVAIVRSAPPPTPGRRP